MKLPQLSLRELFLLVVIAAMGCGWWVSERQAREQLGLANAQALEAERAVVLCQEHFLEVGRAWAKEVNRDLMIGLPPKGGILVDPRGGVRYWGRNARYPDDPREDPPDVVYSERDYSPIGQRQLPYDADDQP